MSPYHSISVKEIKKIELNTDNFYFWFFILTLKKSLLKCVLNTTILTLIILLNLHF